jgi:predicted TIM-barrel fold metal-dependent hydrolase
MHLWQGRTDLPPEFGDPPVDYLITDYVQACRGLGITKAVLVRAAMPRAEYVEESGRLARVRRQTGILAAEVGAVALDAEFTRTIEFELSNPLFRGVRLLAPLDYSSRLAKNLLGTLEEANLVYDLVCHPGSVAAAADAAGRNRRLQFVVEHAGWPTASSQFSIWRDGMANLAQHDNVACKISGLPMALRTANVEALDSWVAACIRSFGPERCMFGSNMPVDGFVAPLRDVFLGYLSIIAKTKADPETVFRRTAERVYRI